LKEEQMQKEEDSAWLTGNYRTYLTVECMSNPMEQSPWEANIHVGGQEIALLSFNFEFVTSHCVI
jgi:hypothetical protein